MLLHFTLAFLMAPCVWLPRCCPLLALLCRRCFDGASIKKTYTSKGQQLHRRMHPRLLSRRVDRKHHVRAQRFDAILDVPSEDVDTFYRRVPSNIKNEQS